LLLGLFNFFLFFRDAKTMRPGMSALANFTKVAGNSLEFWKGCQRSLASLWQICHGVEGISNPLTKSSKGSQKLFKNSISLWEVCQHSLILCQRMFVWSQSQRILENLWNILSESYPLGIQRSNLFTNVWRT
jgi:hypothetical protein